MNLPYQQASGVSDGDEVQSFTGQCTAVYPQEDKGKYKIQNIGVSVDGCPLKVSIFGSPAPVPSSAKGKKITFTSTGGKYGTIKYSVFNGKEQFTVGNKANYEIVDGGGYGEEQTSAPAAPSRAQNTRRPPIPQNDTQEAFLTRLTDFHKKCYQAVVETYPDMEQNEPAMFQGFVSSIFITADRAGVQHFPCEPKSSPRGNRQQGEGYPTGTDGDEIPF